MSHHCPGTEILDFLVPWCSFVLFICLEVVPVPQLSPLAQGFSEEVLLQSMKPQGISTKQLEPGKQQLG